MSNRFDVCISDGLWFGIVSLVAVRVWYAIHSISSHGNHSLCFGLSLSITLYSVASDVYKRQLIVRNKFYDVFLQFLKITFEFVVFQAHGHLAGVVILLVWRERVLNCWFSFLVTLSPVLSLYPWELLSLHFGSKGIYSLAGNQCLSTSFITLLFLGIAGLLFHCHVRDLW